MKTPRLLPALFVMVTVLSGAATVGVRTTAAADLRLVTAVKAGNAAEVRALLDAKVDPNAPERDGTTPLHWAVYRDDLTVADLLIRAGARVATANRYGVQPLTLACVNGNLATVERLLGAGADPNAAQSNGETALMTAARTGVVLVVKALLDAGAKVDAKENAVDSNGETAMHGAAYKHVPSVARYLAQAGASVDVWNQKNKAGWTPLAITEGIHRGMNIISSSETEAAIREILARAPASSAAVAPSRPQ